MMILFTHNLLPELFEIKCGTIFAGCKQTGLLADNETIQRDDPETRDSITVVAESSEYLRFDFLYFSKSFEVFFEVALNISPKGVIANVADALDEAKWGDEYELTFVVHEEANAI
jgi:hypothetical protein